MSSLTMMDKYEAVIKAQSGILYIEGRPGEAKTAIAEAIAEKNGWQFIDIRLAQVDSAEVIGIPVRNELNGQIVHTYALPEWAVLANEKPTLVFFDELNRAVLETRNAALQILNERKIGWNFKFNKNVHFMSAGNLGEEDGTEVEELDAALRNRLVIMRHTLEFKDWKKWATETRLNKHLVAFLEMNTTAIHDDDGAQNDQAYASYRSWTNLGRFLDSLNLTEPLEIQRYVGEIGPAYVGKKAQKFVRYLTDIANVAIQDVIKNFPSVKANLDPRNQARMYELLTELEAYDFLAFKKREMNNLIKFFELIHEDKLVAYAKKVFDKILESSDKHVEYVTDSNGNSSVRLKDIDNFKTFMSAFEPVYKAMAMVMTGQGEKEQYSESDEDSDDE